MANTPTIYFICGAGLGSSLACQMEAEEVLAAMAREGLFETTRVGA